MAKKRKLRKESTSDLGMLLGLGHIFVSLCVTRSSPFSVALWLMLMLAVFIRCAQKRNDDRIMGFPGLCAIWGGFLPAFAMRGCMVESSLALLAWILFLTGIIFPPFCLSVWRKERKEKPWSKAVLCVIGLSLIFLFSINAAQLINTAFDRSEPTRLTAAVTEKQENHRVCSATSWHILAEVPGETEALRFNVSRQHYRAFALGDEVTVTRHEGFLGAPWWEMEPMAE